MSVLTDLPIAPGPPHVSQGGYVSKYNPTFGYVAGLSARLLDWRRRLGENRGQTGSPGLGLAKDLEMAAQILNLREFGEHLRVNGTSEQGEWAEELLRNEETLEAVDAALGNAGLVNFDPPAAVETLTRERDADRRQIQAVRALLVEQGMLAEGDTTTPVADLLRVLLA